MRHLRKAAAILALSMIAWAISAPAAAAQKYSIEVPPDGDDGAGDRYHPATSNPGRRYRPIFRPDLERRHHGHDRRRGLCPPASQKRAVALPANVSQCTLSYQIGVSQTTAANSQANETDLMIVDPNGTLYNGSMREEQPGGRPQRITNSAGGWVDAGFNLARFRLMCGRRSRWSTRRTGRRSRLRS